MTWLVIALILVALCAGWIFLLCRLSDLDESYLDALDDVWRR